MPAILDAAKPYRLRGTMGLVAAATAIGLAVVLLVLGIRWWTDPGRHRFARWLKRFGPPAEVANAIEAERESGACLKFDDEFITRSWLGREQPFHLTLIRTADVVWIYRTTLPSRRSARPREKVHVHCHDGRSFRTALDAERAEVFEAAVADRAPHAWVGYDEEVAEHWQEDPVSLRRGLENRVNASETAVEADSLQVKDTGYRSGPGPRPRERGCWDNEFGHVIQAKARQSVITGYVLLGLAAALLGLLLLPDVKAGDGWVLVLAAALPLATAGALLVFFGRARLADPGRSAVARALACYGEPAEVADAIEDERESSECRIYSPEEVTANWILQRSQTGLNVCYLPELVWVSTRAATGSSANVQNLTKGQVAALIIAGLASGGHAVHFMIQGMTQQSRTIWRTVLRDARGHVMNVTLPPSMGRSFLRTVCDRAPWAVVGDDAKLADLWKNDRAALIAAVSERRRQCEA
ncbi:MAG: hypothetical protein ACJ8F7_04740 [Gemmataceae bacterium]